MAVVASPAGEDDNLYGEEDDDEELSSTTNVGDDAMIKVKGEGKSSTHKKGSGKTNKTDTRTKKKANPSGRKK